jgi:uncharacterized membrane protein YfcA
VDLIPTQFLVFVLWGCGVGFLAGLFGIGGGGLIVPLLIFSYEHSGVSPAVLTHIAISTSLFVIFFASLTSAYQHNKQHNVDWRAALMLGFSSALTAFATARLAVALKGQYLRLAFAIITVIIALRMLTEGKRQGEKKSEPVSKSSRISMAGIGVTAGAVSALAGVGGGGVTIPMMYYFLKMPLKLAIGTSSATMVITALFSVGGYVLHGIGRTDLPAWSFGFVDFQRGTALVIGSLLMARIGAYVSFKTHPYHLRRLFALFLISISIYLIFFK